MRVPEVVLALGILVVVLVSVQGLIHDAGRLVGVGEDLLDIQQRARIALEKFSKEVESAARVVDDRAFFGRPPAVAPPTSCVGPGCPQGVTFEIPSANGTIAGCAYYVRYAHDMASHTLTRQVKPDPAQGAVFGTGGCVAASPEVLAADVAVLTIEYCDAAGVCAGGVPAVPLTQVVRVNGHITVAAMSGGMRQQLAVNAGASLRAVPATVSVPATHRSPESK